MGGGEAEVNDWLPKVERSEPSRCAAVGKISDGSEARLIRDNGGRRAAILANFLIALRHAPEWAGVLGHDEAHTEQSPGKRRRGAARVSLPIRGQRKMTSVRQSGRNSSES